MAENAGREDLVNEIQQSERKTGRAGGPGARMAGGSGSWMQPRQRACSGGAAAGGRGRKPRRSQSSERWSERMRAQLKADRGGFAAEGVGGKGRQDSGDSGSGRTLAEGLSLFAPSIPSRPRSRRGTSGSWGRSGRRTIGPRRGRSSERRRRQRPKQERQRARGPDSGWRAVAVDIRAA